MFKKCASCHKEWEQFEAFLADRDLTFQGYQAAFRNPDAGLFLFNHVKEGCQTTLSVRVSLIRERLMPGCVFEAFTPHGEGCPGYCANPNNLEMCPNPKCNGRMIRALIQELKRAIAEAEG